MGCEEVVDKPVVGLLGRAHAELAEDAVCRGPGDFPGFAGFDPFNIFDPLTSHRQFIAAVDIFIDRI